MKYDVVRFEEHKSAHSQVLVLKPSELERSVLQLNGRIAPRDKVADRVSLVERIKEVSHFRCLPDKGALNLWDGNFTDLDPVEQRIDRLRSHGIALGLHKNRCSASPKYSS